MPTRTLQETPFRTSDSSFAGVLLTLGIRLVDVVWEGNSAKFVFDPEERDIKQILSSYTNGDLRLPIRNFIQSLAEVKRLLHTYPRS